MTAGARNVDLVALYAQTQTQYVTEHGSRGDRPCFFGRTPGPRCGANRPQRIATARRPPCNTESGGDAEQLPLRTFMSRPTQDHARCRVDHTIGWPEARNRKKSTMADTGSDHVIAWVTRWLNDHHRSCTKLICGRPVKTSNGLVQRALHHHHQHLIRQQKSVPRGSFGGRFIFLVRLSRMTTELRWFLTKEKEWLHVFNWRPSSRDVTYPSHCCFISS